MDEVLEHFVKTDQVDTHKVENPGHPVTLRYILKLQNTLEPAPASDDVVVVTPPVLSEQTSGTDKETSTIFTKKIYPTIPGMPGLPHRVAAAAVHIVVALGQNEGRIPQTDMVVRLRDMGYDNDTIRRAHGLLRLDVVRNKKLTYWVWRMPAVR
jgi:hypothetical protein